MLLRPLDLARPGLIAPIAPTPADGPDSIDAKFTVRWLISDERLRDRGAELLGDHDALASPFIAPQRTLLRESPFYEG